MPERYAIYVAPEAETALHRRADTWLDGHQPLTASARRYGFHGTMKAPFRLTEGTTADQLIAAFDAFCAGEVPLAPLPLKISRLGPFFALTPAAPAPELNALAARAVEAFEPFRAPLSDADIARRRPERLDETERANLRRWGYPYVMDRFRFHMTLTGPVAGADAPAIEAELRVWFADSLSQPLTVDRLTIFQEPAPGAPFHLYHQHQLGRGNP